ncbi:alpha/beta hydrolase [Gemmobacter fulvus]|uniref:Alpha/beta hydrolase n=1 Tax=Gemmobacter fulvus TaxID=2840474 RepID=A0A975P8H8_9RHOB|nr:alpha/beta hydrolase [Gemmobacter fulvus]MBT9244755.1 alpha/beta hydrolase [Gemmobacter fulvus]QWK91604.1 alpha/beta hydrolase [Gemmobacter fulvus]
MAIDCAYTIEGQGPALFLIHGIGARKTGFAKVVAALKDRFTCISYDLRGHGDSPLPEGRFGLEDLVDDLEALRDRLGIAQAHFAGHSLGGMIGPAYAHRYPDRVLSLGLLSTAAFRTEDDSAKVKAVVAQMRDKGIGQVLDTLTARWFTDAFAAAHPEVIAWRKQQVLDTPAEVFLTVFDIYAETEMAPWLHEVAAPALVLTGELDGGCNPRLNQQIAAALPKADLVILEGLKHAILIEASERVVPPLRQFLLRQS